LLPSSFALYLIVMVERVLGIDIGGSSIKFGLVETSTGSIAGKADSIELALNATPSELLEAIKEARDRLGWTGSIGIGYPGVVKQGRTLTAAHLDDSFLGLDWLTELRTALEVEVGLINDADAAGLAEVRFGAGAGSDAASILVATLGTGIGTAFFYNGRLFPNTEFGHMLLGDTEAEDLAAGSVRVAQNLSFETYGARLTRFLNEMERLIAPDLIILGGAISEDFGKFQPFLDTRCTTVPARLGNSAGLIGAALAVHGIDR
jgi:polyphosphate glucokinase